MKLRIKDGWGTPINPLTDKEARKDFVKKSQKYKCFLADGETLHPDAKEVDINAFKKVYKANINRKVLVLKDTNEKAKTIRDITTLHPTKAIVYIAGKVTGLPYNEVVENFEKAHKQLEQSGFYVVNPIRLVHQDADWQEAMRICISYLPHADAVFALENYKDSAGALLEVELAEKLGITIL